MNGKRSNEETLRDANLRLCRLRLWSNYHGFGFYVRERFRPPHLIHLIEPNSPAAAGGLKINDLLLAINTTMVSETAYARVIEILQTAQNTHPPIELLVVEQQIYEILRRKNITIDRSFAKTLSTPMRMPNDYIKFSKYIPRLCHICLQPNETHFGFNTVTGQYGIGVFIQEVIPGSPAYRAGLRKSDRILEINGECVNDETRKFIIEKLNKALTQSTVKLLVVDTETHDRSNIDDDDAYAVNHYQLASYRSRSNSEELPLNRSTYEYIALESNQRIIKTTRLPIKNKNNQKEFHSFNCPIKQTKTIMPSQKDHHNKNNTLSDDRSTEIRMVQYEHPYDYNESISDSHARKTASTFCKSTNFNKNTPSHNRHQFDATTLSVQQNNNSVYLEPSTILLQFEDQQTKKVENCSFDTLSGMEDITNTKCVSGHEPSTGNEACNIANQRFFDIQNEPLLVMLPIEGYEDMPLVSLATAVENLEKIIYKIKRNAWIACERSVELFDGLTSDESASIQLYTMKWKVGYQPLSIWINAALRAENRDLFKPYFSYFKLILTALWKLKSIERKVWRGVKGDMRIQYPIGKTFIWWGFSSCMKSRDLLESDQYLGNNGVRTLFHIECQTGKSIRSHSYNKHEKEVLLLPATQLQVIDQEKIEDNLHIIYLKEIPSRYTLLQSPFQMDDLLVPRKMDRTNRSIQESINRQKTEHKFFLHQQSITTKDMQLIANEIQSNKYWSTISLQQTCLHGDDLTVLMNTLQTNLLITCLDLRSNRLDDHLSLILARCLKTNVYLKTVDLADNQITEIGALSYADMLLINKTLLNFNLSSNNISDTGLISIIRALRHNHTLESLYLNQIQLTERGSRGIATNFQLNTSFKVLHLNQNNLNDNGTALVVQFLSHNKQIHNIHLATNNITFIGVEKIITLLQQTNSSLSALDLSSNPLRDVGTILIAQALMHNTTLNELRLDAVDMTADSLQELSKMIRVNNTLKYLSLKENEIDDHGMIILLDGLQCNNVLTYLYLDMNRLTDKCLSSVVHVLQNNNTLKYFGLSNNHFTEQGKLPFNEKNRTKFLW